MRGFSENIGSVFCLLHSVERKQQETQQWTQVIAGKVLSILPAESVLAIQLGRLKLEKTQLGVLFSNYETFTWFLKEKDVYLAEAEPTWVLPLLYHLASQHHMPAGTTSIWKHPTSPQA